MALDVELAEIRDFLAAHPPFAWLPASVLERLPTRMSIVYRRRGSVVIAAGQRPTELLVVRSGAVEVRAGDGELLDRGAAGSCPGARELLAGAPHVAEVRAIEDSLLLALPAAEATALAEAHPDLAAYFAAPPGGRLWRAVAGADHRSDQGDPAVLRTRIGDLVPRPPVTVSGDTPVREAARTMTEERISSVLVVEQERLVGILTDRDLRSRVVAEGLEPATPVRRVMSAEPVTAGPDTLALEALLEMLRRQIHHLPLVHLDRVVGIVTATDLLRLEQADPVLLVGDVDKAADADAVAAVAGRLAPLVATLVRRGSAAQDVGRVVTTIGDAVERRLIALVEAELGPPPAPYAWLTLGSRARYEQALGPDQDHALVLHDDADPADPWFAELAARVADGLERAGYPRCRGEKMATNPRWRLTLAQWQRQLTRWVTEPTPDAVFEASVFFDLRHQAGDPDLTAALLHHQREAARTAPLFLAYLAGHATRAHPPIGFFRHLVVDRTGEHRDTLDVKRGGLLVIAEIARVHALAAGSEHTHTFDRLEDAVTAGRLSAPLAADLRDAWEFLAHLRLRHQAELVDAGQPPDSRVAPGTLSDFEKRHLKAAFEVIRSGQTALTLRYPVRAIT